MKKAVVFGYCPRVSVCWGVVSLSAHVSNDNVRGMIKELQLMSCKKQRIISPLRDNLAYLDGFILFGLFRDTTPEKRLKFAGAVNARKELLSIKYILGSLPKFIQRFRKYFCTRHIVANCQRKLDASSHITADFRTGFRTFSQHCSRSSNGIVFFPNIRKLFNEVLRCLTDARKIAGEVLRYLADARNLTGEVLRYLADARNVAGEVLRYFADARNLTGEVFFPLSQNCILFKFHYIIIKKRKNYVNK
jgi:hypothetical protein